MRLGLHWQRTVNRQDSHVHVATAAKCALKATCNRPPVRQWLHLTGRVISMLYGLGEPLDIRGCIANQLQLQHVHSKINWRVLDGALVTML